MRSSAIYRPVGEVAEGGDGGGGLGADQQQAEAGGMVEAEGGVALAALGPELPDAEVAAADGGVVQQDDGAVGEFRQPGLEVVAHGVVGVQAVDMQQVDAAGDEAWQRIVEAAAEQGGEGAVVGVVEGLQIGIGAVVIGAGMGVALPGVDGEAAGGQAAGGDGVADRRIGDAGFGAELDGDPRGLRPWTSQCMKATWPCQALGWPGSAGGPEQGVVMRAKDARSGQRGIGQRTATPGGAVWSARAHGAGGPLMVVSRSVTRPLLSE